MRLQTVRPESVAFSADGRLLATGSCGDGKSSLVVREIKSGKRLTRMASTHTGWVSVALSSDGKWLASWGAPAFRGLRKQEDLKIAQKVQLWDPVTGKQTGKIETDDSVACVAFSPDRKTLALATWYGNVQVWDVACAKRLRSWRGPTIAASPLAYLAFSPDGKTVLYGSRRQQAPPSVWNVATGQRLRVARAPRCSFHAAAFLANGRIVACGFREQTVVMWELLSGKRLTCLEGHFGSVLALSFLPDGQRLYSAATDRRIIEWDVSGKRLRFLPNVRLGRNDSRPDISWPEAVFSPGGAYLSSNERAETMVCVRDVQTGQDVFILPRFGIPRPSAPAFSLDGKRMAVAQIDEKGNARVQIIRLESGAELSGYPLGTNWASSLAFDPSGKRLAVCIAPQNPGPGATAEVHVWRLDLHREVSDFKPVSLGEKATRLLADQGSVTLAFSPDGAVLVACFQGVIRLLDARTGKEKDRLSVGETVSHGPLFSPDGRTLAVAYRHSDQTDPVLSLWEMRTCKKRWASRVPTAVTALAFAPSGKVLASGHLDSSILLWDVSGQRTERMGGSAHLKELWEALASDDAQKAFAAQRVMSAGGGRSVTFLRQRLRPVQCKAAEQYRREIRKGKPSVEVLQALRAVEVLEWIGSPAARKLIEELSRGRPAAVLLLEAGSSHLPLLRQRHRPPGRAIPSPARVHLPQGQVSQQRGHGPDSERARLRVRAASLGGRRGQR